MGFQIANGKNNLSIAAHQIVEILRINGVMMFEVNGVFDNVKAAIQHSPVGGRYIPPTSEQQERLIELLKELFQDYR